MDNELVKQKMQEVVDLVIADVGSIRTGRATPSLVEDIVVAAYGDGASPPSVIYQGVD